VSARWRSRIAIAVRCPNSASKIAARAIRLPARRDLIRSEGRTVTFERRIELATSTSDCPSLSEA